MIAKPKLLLIIGIAITGISVGLGLWAVPITKPTTFKIIQCMSEKNPNETFTGPDLQSQLEECASGYPYDPSAGLVLSVSNLLLLAGIIIDIVAVILFIRDWYHRNRKTGSIKSKSSSRYDE